MAGKIDVHSHLLPGIDDGCKTIEESLELRRILVEHGYTHSFCTPHIRNNLPANNVTNIPLMTAALQTELDNQNIALKLFPGGENNIQPDLIQTSPDAVVTFGMNRKFVLIDLWADKLPAFFASNVKWLQSLGLTVILAHPEQMRRAGRSRDRRIFHGIGVLLQGNLACFSDAPHTDTRRVAEHFLEQDCYFCVGSDLHGLGSMRSRLRGLARVAEQPAMRNSKS